jgi:UDP-N-acetylglucosamine 4,6-dehydratase/5-epimerase
MVMPLTGNVLVTGGSGTLGHAIVRTALHERWDCAFTIYSRSELRQAQMRQQYPSLRYVLGDVRDYDRLQAAITGHDVVVHAAAVKRIPEAEQQPVNCYETNVIGSMNVARACVRQSVKRCIGVSTDKACRAITAYGASKLAMEKLFQAQPEGPCIFTLVRYGNVVASNGSVIPLWRQQAKEGKPLTVTDPEMTRFWMGESDAVGLVKTALTMAEPSGIILVPKMCSLSLSEMAHIIAPGAELKTIGVRSVEKKHEDLIHADEPVTLDRGLYFWVKEAPYASKGYRYTSYDAPRLTPQAFRAMLAEAEAHE